MFYVTDTHPLLWFLGRNYRLGGQAKEAFEEAETGNAVIIIPTIVLAELLHILEKAGSKERFREILHKIRDASNYEPFPLSFSIIERLFHIPELTELHDRIIVATAQTLGCALITKDGKIRESGTVQCIW